MSTLRAWESRFSFLEPRRSPAGHRLYDEADVDRVNAVLRLLAEGLTLAAAIARVANVGTASLPAGEAESLLYNQILQNVGQGIWVVREGRSRYVNRRMAELMRYSIDELLALPVLDIFHPDELSLVKERAEQLRAGHTLHFTQHLRRGDGTTFLAEVKTTQLLDQAGRYEGSVAVVEDITARDETQTQAQLRAALLDSIGEAVTASTPDGTVVYVNAAAERLFGWRAADVLGRASRDVFPTPTESAEQVARISAVLRNGRRYSGSLKMTRSDGHDFVAQLTSVPAFDEQGTHIGFVGVITDQTERDRRDRRQQARERQAETIALLVAHAFGQRSETLGATKLLTEALEATRRLLDADHAAVLDVVVGSDELLLRSASPPTDKAIAVPSGSRSFAGYTALAGKVIVVDDAENDHRFDPSPTHPDGPTSSAIGAPIFGPDGICAVLIAESSRPKTFDNDDVHFIQAVANIIGTALPT